MAALDKASTRPDRFGATPSLDYDYESLDSDYESLDPITATNSLEASSLDCATGASAELREP